MTGDAMREPQMIAAIRMAIFAARDKKPMDAAFDVYAAITAAPPAARLALTRAITPDTHAVVPVEPSLAMCLAGPGRANQATEESMYHGIYRAMIAAARKESDDGR